MEGHVAVNGEVVTELGSKADPEHSEITVDGNPINLNPKTVYVLLNKPKGYTSTRKDPYAPRVVTELVKDIGVNLYPVGRLDVDTEGLLILTNDGDFTQKMTHPRHQVPKTYRAEVRGLVPQDTLRQLSRGVKLDDGHTLPAKTKLIALNTARQTSIVDIIIKEGRKRQVRRMFDVVGHPVNRLIRLKIGDISIDGLKTGEWRFLSQEEVDNLTAQAQ